MSRRNHGKTPDDRHHRKGLENPSYQHDESQHGIERITSPKRNRKTRSSIYLFFVFVIKSYYFFFSS
jgi:transposase InsO family protein